MTHLHLYASGGDLLDATGYTVSIEASFEWRRLLCQAQRYARSVADFVTAESIGTIINHNDAQVRKACDWARERRVTA